MSERVVVLEVSVIEAVHLSGMVRQFVELLQSAVVGGSIPDDPALGRLVPDAYVDDAEASEEFRRLTGSDLLDRRRHDASIVLATLSPDGTDLALTGSGEDVTRTSVLTLDDEESAAWMRVLAAVRLVLASRLGIESEGDHDEDDPRFGVYEWLGVRLDGLVQAVDAAS